MEKKFILKLKCWNMDCTL